LLVGEVDGAFGYAVVGLLHEEGVGGVDGGIEVEVSGEGCVRQRSVEGGEVKGIFGDGFLHFASLRMTR
jgi:hypothetical protein